MKKNHILAVSLITKSGLFKLIEGKIQLFKCLIPVHIHVINRYMKALSFSVVVGNNSLSVGQIVICRTDAS